MAAQYPMTFKVKSKSETGIHSSWQGGLADKDLIVPIAIPPEFDGPGGGFSPEDLYALALQNCFIATFKVFAEKSRLQFSQINVESALNVDRNEQGKPWMARIHFEVQLKGVFQADNAKRILERTSQNCMILNSVDTQKSFNFQISES